MELCHWLFSGVIYFFAGASLHFKLGAWAGVPPPPHYLQNQLWLTFTPSPHLQHQLRPTSDRTLRGKGSERTLGGKGEWKDTRGKGQWGDAQGKGECEPLCMCSQFSFKQVINGNILLLEKLLFLFNSFQFKICECRCLKPAKTTQLASAFASLTPYRHLQGGLRR